MRFEQAQQEKEREPQGQKETRMVEHMLEEIKKTAIDEFGGLKQWKEHYIKTISSKDMKKRYQKMVEWFGGKEEYLATVKNPISKEVARSYQKRIDVISEKLAVNGNILQILLN